MTTFAEKTALEYVWLCGKLAAAVEWCVLNSGKCLDDNPRQLAYAQKVYAKALAKRRDVATHRAAYDAAIAAQREERS